MSLYWAVLGNKVARALLGLHIIALCRAKGCEWDARATTYSYAEDGVVVTVDGEPLGWFPLEDLIPYYPGAA